MATITEDYVSFETAKLLKEKGFNSKCIAYYLVFNENIKFYECNNLGQSLPYISNDNWTIILKNPLESGYAAPTIQMAMKWLREVHNLIIYVKLVNDGDLYHDAWGFVIYNKFTNEYIKSDKLWFKYEEAAEAAVRYCLENLI